jgi:hypothetical protein
MSDIKVVNDFVIHRGQVLYNCSILEKPMMAIGRYFCKDDAIRSDLYNFILATERMTWSNKLDVFRLIVENNDKLIGNNKYKNFKLNNPKYYREIREEIIEHRNRFAHQILDTREGYIERYNQTGIFAFIDFKVSHAKESGDVNYHEYNQTKVTAILKLCEKYGIALADMNDNE